MNSISKLSNECEKCPNKDTCNNKRMVACALAKLPKMANDISKPYSNPMASPMKQTVTPITIHMGEYGNIDTTAEAIKEQLNNQIRESLGLNMCDFNK
ncbi:hypothetical protein FC777_11250 [Clostridium botulinum]|nr:hypothetical protein [Clostridium botulinum]